MRPLHGWRMGEIIKECIFQTQNAVGRTFHKNSLIGVLQVQIGRRDWRAHYVISLHVFELNRISSKLNQLLNCFDDMAKYLRCLMLYLCSLQNSTTLT
jgi:hypothetical protein